MSVYKMSEKEPQPNQYCFVKMDDNWIFTMYAGENKWNLYKKQRDGIQIEEWQPAFLKLANTCIDILTKKVYHDLYDVQNEENESYLEEFIQSIEVPNGNSSGNNSDPESGRSDVQGEVPVLRADSIERV